MIFNACVLKVYSIKYECWPISSIIFNRLQKYTRQKEIFFSFKLELLGLCGYWILESGTGTGTGTRKMSGYGYGCGSGTGCSKNAIYTSKTDIFPWSNPRKKSAYYMNALPYIWIRVLTSKLFKQSFVLLQSFVAMLGYCNKVNCLQKLTYIINYFDFPQ